MLLLRRKTFLRKGGGRGRGVQDILFSKKSQNFSGFLSVYTPGEIPGKISKTPVLEILENYITSLRSFKTKNQDHWKFHLDFLGHPWKFHFVCN